MAKKGNNKKNKNVEKIDEVVSSNNGWYDKVIVILVVLCILCLFYLVTVKITINEEINNTTGSNETDKPTVIQYDEILVGNTFNKNDEKYFVVYYDMSKDDASDVASAISTYEAGAEALPLYVVDMSDPLNKKYASKESNSSAGNASDLRINGVTLVRVKDGNLDKYLEGKDEVIEYLER